MALTDKDILKGMLLDRWTEDLRQDRPPSTLPEMQQLTQQEIVEVLAQARWLITLVEPAAPPSSELQSVLAEVRARIERHEEQQDQTLGDAVSRATSFGDLLLLSRRARKVRVADLERDLKLSAGMLSNLETAKVPPHRIPISTMAALLRALRIARSEVVEFVYQAGFTWANSAYTRTATQLGRIDAQPGTASRHDLLSEAATHDDHPAQLAEELEQLERYCQSLSAQLS